MKNTITEIKNSLEAAKCRIQKAEERISEVEDRVVEIMDAEQKREKLKTNEVSENSGTMLNAPTSILQGCQKEKRERRGQKKYLKR